MLRPDRKVIAVVTAKIVNGKQTVKAELFSRLESGELVLTGNAADYDIAGVPSGIIAEFKGYPSAQEQLDAHATQLATIGQLAQLLDEKEAMFEYLKMNLQELEFLEEKKMIVEIAGTEPRQYRLRRAALPFLSLKALFISFTSLKKYSKSWSNPTIRSRSGLTEDVTHTHQAKDVRWALDEQTLMDLTEYQSQKSKKGKSSGFGKKAIIMILSLIAMAVALRFMGFTTLTDVVAVLVILFIHELGHFAMMKIFGYQGLSIFFIPFFGAAATGTKRLATAREQFWVLMMGPLPGFVVGLVILGAGYFLPSTPGWLLNAAFLSVVINGFNLLPLSFLDGGRILDLLIFRRVPRLRMVLMLSLIHI